MILINQLIKFFTCLENQKTNFRFIVIFNFFFAIFHVLQYISLYVSLSCLLLVKFMIIRWEDNKWICFYLDHILNIKKKIKVYLGMRKREALTRCKELWFVEKRVATHKKRIVRTLKTGKLFLVFCLSHNNALLRIFISKKKEKISTILNALWTHFCP